MRISALEELLRGKTAEHQSQVDENMKAQHNRLMTIQEKQRVQARCLDLKQRDSVNSASFCSFHASMRRTCSTNVSQSPRQ